MNLSVKTIRFSNFNDNNFNPSDSNISLWRIRYEVAVWRLKALIGSLQGFTLIIPRIGSF